MTKRHVAPSGTPLQVAGSPDAPRALIVLQEAFGVNDHIRAVTESFAAADYYAAAPELFHRNGSPEIAYDQFPDAMASLATLSADGLRSDIEDTLHFLHDANYSTASIGVVGYCMGGSVAFFAATLGGVGAAVSFYGGGVATGRFGLPSLLDQASLLRCPWNGHYGDLDKGIPVEQVEALRTATAAGEFSTHVYRYADADHGFNCDGRPAVFNRDASLEATARTLTFFEQQLSAR